MNTIQRITKNVGVLFISQMLSYVLGFFTLMYSARYLGVEGFGTLSLALAFTGIFSVFMDLGLSTLTIREVARNKSLAKEYVDNITLIKLVLAVITLLLIFIIIHLLGYNHQTMQVIYIITLYTLFTAFSQLFYAVFQAHEKMEYQSIGTILSSVLLFAGVFVAVYLKLDLVNFSLIYLVSGASILVYALIIYVQKFSLPKIVVNLKKWKDLIEESWPFAVTGIFMTLYFWMDTIILSVIQGTDAVGIYNASYKLIMVLLFIPITFSNSIFPLMSKYYISSEESLKLLFEKLFKVMLLIAIPLGIGTVLISEKIISLIYGAQFIKASVVLQILIWSTVFIYIRTPFQILLESSNKQIAVTKIFIMGTIFNVILNLIIIPSYGYIGAGIINVVTDALVLGFLVITTRSSMRISISTVNLKKSSLKILIASLVMGMVLKYLINLNIFLLILIGTVIYVSMLLILKIFANDEIKMIKSIFMK